MICSNWFKVGNFLVSGYQWVALEAQAARTRFNSLAPSTKNNIQTHLRAYLLFSLYFQVPPFPVTLDNILIYHQFLTNSLKAPGSSKNYLYGLQTACRFLEVPCPQLNHFLITSQLKGAARSLQHLPHRARPLTPAILLQLAPYVNPQHPYSVSWWAALLTGFFCFARIANILPRSPLSFTPGQDLCRSNFVFYSDCILVNFNHSKTNQLGDRLLSLPLAPLDSPLCPVQAITNMFALSPTPPSYPAFSFTLDHQPFIITQSQFISTLRSLLTTVGQEPTGFSGHSMRRGGATLAFSVGVPSELIKLHGDWASEAYLTYLEMAPLQRLEVTSKMGEAC